MTLSTRRRLQSLTICLVCSAPALVCAEDGENRGPPRRGFVLEVGLPVHSATIPVDEAGGGAEGTILSLLAGQDFVPRFFLGGHLGRVDIELGFNVAHSEIGTEYTDEGDEWEEYLDVLTLTFAPTLRVAAGQYWQNRVRLLVSASVLLGAVLLDQRDRYDGEEESTSTLSLGFDVALGVRYHLHSCFALGADIGFQGVFFRNHEEDDYGADAEHSMHALGFYGAIFATVVLGR